MSSTNNFGGATFGYSIPENNDFNSYGHPIEVTGEPSTYDGQASGFDLDAALAGPSVAGIENQWLGPQLDDNAGQYAGSTVLAPCNEFDGGYGLQTGCISGVGGFSTSESHRSLLSVENAAFNTDDIRR